MMALQKANARDDAALSQILSMIREQTSAVPSAVPSVLLSDQHPFCSKLCAAGENYTNLAPFAARIVETLGLSELADFKFISEEEVSNVKLPALQQRLLMKLAIEHKVGSEL
jgi:hypothetical protein